MRVVRRQGVVCMLACAAALVMPIGTVTATAVSSYSHLQPGSAVADLVEEVPVNVVFVGYDADDIDRDAFLGGLPASYRPVVRSRLW